MDRRTILSLILVFCIICIGAFVFFNYQTKQRFDQVVPEAGYQLYTGSAKTDNNYYTSTPSPVSGELKTYLNEKYGYSFKYRGDLTVDGFYTNHLTVEPAFSETETSIGLEKYAHDLWEINKNDVVPNIPNHKVSDLEKTTQNGRTAFSFTAEGSFKDQHSAYVLDEKTTYILTANQNNNIFIIHYPTDSEISKEIFSTLKIDAGLIASKEEPSNWKKYENKELGFQFEYPGNIFTNETELSGSYVFALNGKRGGMNIRVMDTALDPNNIEDMYGKIENPEKVKIGVRDAYAFNWGDAGCGAKRFDVALTTMKTLRISFDSCSEDLYLVSQDASLQSQILSTFKFSE